MSSVQILHSIDSLVLAEEICDSLNDGVMDFILYVDAYMADTSFTAELIERLTGALNEEEKFNGTHTA